MKFQLILLLFFWKGLFSQTDTIPYRVLASGKVQTGKKGHVLITSDKDYFDYYFNTYGKTPENFRWDFNKEYILVIYKTLTSGSHQLLIDAVLEDEKEIKITVSESRSEFATADMSPQFILVAIKPTDKIITVN